MELQGELVPIRIETKVQSKTHSHLFYALFSIMLQLCSYLHHAPAPRCCMCNEPRVSNQDMADFVHGKRVPPPTVGNVIEILNSPEDGGKKPVVSICRPQVH